MVQEEQEPQEVQETEETETQTQDTGSQEYVVAEESTSDSITVDDKTLHRHGEAVSLTQDQYDRVMAIEGVKLDKPGETGGSD